MIHRTKDFVKNISRTGWIIIISVLIAVILTLITIVIVKKDIDLWPFNNKQSENIEVVSQEKDYNDVDSKNIVTDGKALTVEDIYQGKYENSYESATLYTNNTVEIPVAVVFNKDELQIQNSKNLVCGQMTFATVRIPKTQNQINEVLKMIFANKVLTDFLPGNIIPKYHPNLVYDNSTLDEGVLRVYLKGSLSEDNGRCGISLAISQLTETVGKFDTVKEVEVYLNLQKIN